MYIVYVIHDTNAFCGASKALIYLVESMKCRGDAVSVIAPNNKGVVEYFQKIGVDCIIIPFYIGIIPKYRNIRDIILFIPKLLRILVFNSIALAKTVRVLKKRKVDLIHSNSSVIDIGYLLAKRLKCSHLYHIREFVKDYLGTSYLPNNKTFERRIKAANRYSYTACINPDLQLLFALGNSPFSKVIYDGVLPQKEEMIHPPKKGFILFVGRIESQKGLLPMIEGYVEYLKESEKKMPLKVLGSINQNDYYEEIISVLRFNKILDKVEFCGMQKNVCAYMQAANGIVISSLSEGFGFCMAEAMFNECAVVGYDVSGTHLQFENGLKLMGSEIGYRYHNKKELKEALLKLDYQENETMIKNAWLTVNQLYSKEINMEAIYSYYKYIINQKDNG